MLRIDRLTVEAERVKGRFIDEVVTRVVAEREEPSVVHVHFVADLGVGHSGPKPHLTHGFEDHWKAGTFRADAAAIDSAASTARSTPQLRAASAQEVNCAK